MLELRPYQVTAFESVRAELRTGKRRVLLVSPTGSGKTVVASHIIGSARKKDSEVLFLAHRREIIYQTAKKLKAAGIEYGLILSGHRPSFMAPVHIASIQTLHRRNPPKADLVIFDEAHHTTASTYQKILEAYPEAVILGLTATPCRRDGKGLGGVFESIVHVGQVKELIEQGYLVPITCYAPSKPDLEGVKVTAGDYNEKQLGEKVDRPKLIGDIVEHWERLAKDRLTIVFATSIAHSLHLTEAFIGHGVRAEHLDGETNKDERREILKRLETGDTQVVCNVGVLTEGFDCPEVSCIVLARPTRSYGLFLQMAGRGLRPAPGKKDLLLLDHSGAIYDHGLPDENVHWTLEPGKYAAEVRKYERREPKPWICQNCFFINQPSRSKHCARCGLAVMQSAKSPAIGEGMLQPLKKTIKRKIDLNDKEAIWLDCFWKCKQLKRKIGAAAHMYKKITGVWPRGFKYMPKSREQWQMRADEFYQIARDYSE